MDITDFLTELRGLGVSISLEKDDLRLKAPKGVLTAELRTELSARKPEIIAFLRKAKAAAHQLPPRLLPAPRQERMSLSFAQQRLWFLDQWEPGNPELNIPGALSLSGTIEVSILQKTLQRIVERHESLRTTFGAEDGKPFQTIKEAVPVSLPVVDLEALPPPDRESALQKLFAEAVHHRFDLSSGPLFHFQLIKRSKNEHIFLFIFHHIISDGWSVGIFSEELTALYKAFYTGEPSPLTGLAVHYADFALWQRDWLTGETMDRQLAFWKEKLGENPPVLELPTDFPRPARQSGRGEVYTTVISKPLTEKLTALAKQEECTLFMILLTGFKILLSRYSGQKDIVVGSPIAGRNWKEVEGIIGFFLNSLALRTDISGDPGFLELLGRVKTVTLGAYAHQDVPFEKLLEELETERDLSRSPLFQVFFNMLNLPGGEIELPGLKIADFPLPVVGTKFDFTIYASAADEGILFNLVYCTDLFTRERMVEMMEQYKYLLEQAAANPRTTVSRFSLLTPRAELLLPDPRQVLGDEWFGSVQELFAKKVREHPEKVAVSDKDEQWTYRELNNRANRLANYLTAQGIGPAGVVAIYGHRSASLVWAVWGILKAGGAFVILDPAYPASRLVTVLHLAQPKGFLRIEAAGELPLPVSEHLDDAGLCCSLGLPGRAAAEQEDFLSSYSSDEPGIEVGADDIAYISFTSGSTGTPKGIMGRHGPLSHFLPWQQETFGLTGKDRFSMLSGLAHDPLQRDIFTSLCSGASLHIPDPDQIGEPGWLYTWMKEEGITVAHLTPAMLQLVAQDVQDETDKLLSLHCVLTVGDVLLRRDVARLKQLAPDVTFINLYGSTETQRAVGHLPVPGDPGDLPKEVIPLGRGVRDAQLLVLDKNGRLAGIGELGEICVRSPHLARGYLGDEKLTGERFITNPFTRQPEDRIYRTGDSGRYLFDGCVEFVGRIDYQVKIRGFRIEPGEVEAVIGNHPAVREVVVLARQVKQDDKRLVAYFVPAAGSSVDVKELRTHVSQKLPDFMVPSFFIEIDAFPLTPNGKLDRKALPGPDLSRSDRLENFVQPRTATEKKLAEIWSELLAVEKVGALDNFFELGGHSLLATQVISRIRNAFEVELPLQALFENSTLEDLSGEIDTAGLSGQYAPPPLLPVARNSEFPLSFAQQRLWFLDQFEPNTAFYNIYHALRLSGRLNREVLKATFNEIIRRHESLRTVFVAKEGKPFQVISPAGRFILPEVDLEPFPESECEDRAWQLAVEEANRPFDLSRGPLFRATLLRLHDTEHMLLLTVHHIVADGWSLGVLVSEIKELYTAFYDEKPSPLPDLPVQYASFSVWQRDWLSGDVLESQLHFWQEQLGGGLPVLELPTDYPRPAAQTFPGNVKDFELPADLTGKLNGLAQGEGCTMFMVLLSLFKVLLNRYTGQTDLTVGTPIANRNRTEIEGLIGFFINTLVLRGDLSGNPAFKELLSRVRDVSLRAYAHQDVPFEMLVDALAPERDMSHSPLFQVFFALQNMPMESLELPGLKLEFLDLGRQTAKFDLSLYMYEDEDRLIGRVEYNTDLFSEHTIEAFIRHFRVLSESAAADAAQPISELAILSVEEREQLLVNWNDTVVEYPREACIHDVFAERVGEAADRLAVVCGPEHLSYGELDTRSNQLAHHLRGSGVKEETLVAVCMTRSLAMPVALLAIFKAGGYYVPMDPSYPRERLAMMVEDISSFLSGKAPLLVSMSDLSDLFPGYTGDMILLDRDELSLTAMPRSAPQPLSCAGHLAYTIFTSGSTGRPKGVQIQHRGVINFLNAMRETPGLNNNDIFLSVTTLSFDISVLELFLPLTTGSCVVLVDLETAADGRELSKQISRSCATVIQATPATYRLLLAADWSCPDGLRVLCGGEEMPSGLAEGLLSRGVHLWNMYGPTETTIWSSVFEVNPGAQLSIGTPIDNTRMYILDRYLNPVPVGVPGELYIGGDGLSRGYLNRPDLTAERFIPDAFGGRPGSRCYRTGDLVRYKSDGLIEFFGRMDYQVKVRGFRIELGEIETVMSQHPGLTEVVVVVREDHADDKRITAYFIPEAGGSVSTSDLRHFLSEKLPGYMVPSVFVEMEAFPLTPNGKVNRKALPAPDLSGQETGVEYIAPRTRTEEIVAKIWCEVLHVERVGMKDNFFQLGGHSLLATQIISRLRDEFDVEILLRAIFESPVAASLAEVVDQRISSGSTGSKEDFSFDDFEEGSLSPETPMLPLGPVKWEGDIPLSFAQQRLWFLDQWEPGNPVLNIPGALTLTGTLNVPIFKRCLHRIIQRHESLRTIFGSNQGKPFQAVRADVPVSLQVVDISDLKPAEREAHLLKILSKELSHRFDLNSGPLFHFLLIKRSENEHIFLVIFHHIVSDGWSIGVFFEELATLYKAFSAGKPSPLPELPVQYIDFALWQRGWLTEEVIERQLTYWKDRFEDPPPVLEFPTDFPRSPEQSYQGAPYSAVLSQKLSVGLAALAREKQCTLFMVLLTAFKILMARYSGQTDIVVGSPVAGRNWVEIEGLIGFFLNSLALRTDLSGDPGFLELLSQVKETTLGAYSHQDIPFEKLLEEFSPERDTSRTPLFQVFFNMLNLPDVEVELPGLRIGSFPLPIAVSKFDFTIYIFQREKDIVLSLVYNTDLFTRERMVEMMEQYRFLLEQVEENPRTTLSQFSVVNPQTIDVLPNLKQPLSNEWYGSVQELFSRTAQENPGKPAVTDKDEQWTYAELNRRSNQVAAYLIDKSIATADVVAIYGHRSASLVWAVWAVLKTGAAFVILDPAYPAERLTTILRLSHPKGFLQVESAGEVPPAVSEYLEDSGLHCRLLLPARSIAEKEEFLSTYSTAEPGIEVVPGDLAYISFTSGSTGTPKGIMGCHGSLSHFLPWQQETFELSQADRYSMLSGLAHDPLQRDIFTSLCTGASLHIPDPDQIGTPGWLHDWMVRESISVTHLTPAMLQVLTQADNKNNLSLRYALTVGDVLTRGDVAQLKRLAPEVTVINLYGSTETQRAVGYFTVPGDPYELPKEVVPLGRGVGDAQVVILNNQGQPAGIGELGEICIRSPHLALGYLGDETLTAERFIVNPFTELQEDRIYKTGDSGRYLPAGCVEFAGRLDDQVKIRGFRIEPGEIEAVAGLFPHVSESAVLLREVQPGDNRLVAYIVPVQGHTIDINELRRYLSEKLPDFMVPAFFVEIDALPLTPNGKLDRKALPAPEQDRQAMGVVYVAPRSQTENILVKIWGEVLHLDQIGIMDHFFQLGGHSLLATQVISRVRDEFNIELSVRSIFEAPVVSEFAEIIGKIVSPEISIPSLEPVKREGDIPLSFAQQRLWFLDQFEPDTANYNIYHALRLSGHLNIEILDATLNEIVRRHESLRTVFTSKDGKPFQVISPAGRFELPIVDLEQLPETEREDRAEQLAIEEANRPFDLSRGPLFRATLLRLHDTGHMLLLTVHHIVSDGWSIGVLISEMKELYTAFYDEKPSPLPDLPVQYVDFSVWQRNWLSGDVLESQLSYWREQLGGDLPVLELPTDYPRPAAQTFPGNVKDFDLPADLTRKLNELAGKEGCSLFMVLLSVFKVLLNRYTGQTDICVGTPIANRNRTEIESLIGFFVNTLVLRSNLSGNPTFKELLSQVRETSLSSYGHQDVPFEMLVDIIEPERDMSHSPLFQVLFALQNMPREQLELPGLTLNSLYLGRQTAKFDLTLFTFEYEDRLIGRVEYNTDLFSDATIERFISHFQALLGSVVTDAKQPISQLTLLTAAERKQLLLKWNETAADYPSEKTIRELFEEQVRQNPDNIAVVYKKKQSTYRELDKKSNKLAADLIEKGAQTGSIVGIMEERSIEMIVGLLGIIKTGTAYLPVDINYPGQRITHILKDSAVKHLLTPFHLEDSIKFDGSIIHIGEEDLRCGSDSAPHPADSSGSLAYVMYTSGTTGRPKGILVDNRSVVRLVKNTNYVKFRQGDRILQTGALSFDASTFEIWGSLLNGLTLCLAGKETILSPESLKDAMIRYRVSIIWMTAALFNRMCDADVGIFSSLGHLLVGGDVLSTPHINRVRKAFPDLRIINGYGPTENTTFSTTFPINREFSRNIPIGSPIANSTAYVVDRYKNIVPTGVMGELFVGGDGVARGYLNNPEQTAQKFINNPFNENERLYGTGDKVRRLHDGNIEFIGRFDHQVKIRGFRIELGEIESLISEYPGVKDTVVLVREDVPGEKQLVGYFVSSGEGEAFAVNELREFLEQRLPGYMVPSAFVEMESFPLTSNGKINRKILPAPEHSRQETGIEYIAPCTDTEETVAKIWCEILHLERVGMKDHFFQLGGHSLLATQVISRIRDELKVEIPLRSFFESPVVVQLAEIVDSKILSKSTTTEETITFDSFEEGKL